MSSIGRIESKVWMTAERFLIRSNHAAPGLVDSFRGLRRSSFGCSNRHSAGEAPGARLGFARTSSDRCALRHLETLPYLRPLPEASVLAENGASFVSNK